MGVWGSLTMQHENLQLSRRGVGGRRGAIRRHFSLGDEGDSLAGVEE